MAGQRASSPSGDAGLWREEPAGPPRRSAVPHPEAPSGGRRAARESARRSEPPKKSGVPAALPALGLPLLGALVDEVIGSGVGYVFALLAVLGAVLATVLSTRPGWWWAVSSSPVVVLTVAFGAEYLAHSEKYKGISLGTNGLQVVGHAFPVMGAAVLAALLVVVVRTARSGRGRRG